MSVLRPPVEPRPSERSGDDVDGLLREFFQAALPHPWPAFQQPMRAPLPLARPTGSRRRFRSSLALAASVAILALGLGLLSGKFADRTPSTIRGNDGTGMRPIKDQSPQRPAVPEKK